MCVCVPSLLAVTAEPSGPSSSTGPTTTGSTPTLQPTPSLKAAAKDTGTEVAELQGVPLLHLTAANNRQVSDCGYLCVCLRERGEEGGRHVWACECAYCVCMLFHFGFRGCDVKH